MKHIIAIEGPAGCGKSHLIQRLVQENPTWETFEKEPFSKLRDPRDIQWSARRSVITDLGKLLNALRVFNDKPHTEVVLIDRYYWSQAVYHNVRSGLTFPDNHNIYSWFHQNTEGLRAFMASHLVDPISMPEITYVILQPGIENLRLLRATSSKEYPFGEQDYDRYSKIFRYPDYSHIRDHHRMVIDEYERGLTRFRESQ